MSELTETDIRKINQESRDLGNKIFPLLEGSSINAAVAALSLLIGFCDKKILQQGIDVEEFREITMTNIRMHFAMNDKEESKIQ